MSAYIGAIEGDDRVAMQRLDELYAATQDGEDCEHDHPMTTRLTRSPHTLPANGGQTPPGEVNRGQTPPAP